MLRWNIFRCGSLNPPLRALPAPKFMPMSCDSFVKFVPGGANIYIYTTQCTRRVYNFGTRVAAARLSIVCATRTIKKNCSLSLSHPFYIYANKTRLGPLYLALYIKPHSHWYIRETNDCFMTRDSLLLLLLGYIYTNRTRMYYAYVYICATRPLHCTRDSPLQFVQYRVIPSSTVPEQLLLRSLVLCVYG